MRRELLVEIVRLLPQGLISHGWGWLARRRRPRAAAWALKHVFVRAVGIDLRESGRDIDDFECLEDLFVRPLRPGVRRVDPDPEAVVSPVDGAVGACGTVAEDTLLQVKGRGYSLARLLGDPTEAARYEGGAYATIYLAPHDYHRIHAPVSGEVREAALIPGRLMPVFPEALERVDELFARNERLITYIDSPDAGRVAVVKVGATLVGRITVSYDDTVSTQRSGQRRRTLRYDPPRLMNKGAELGAFELGSTVVLLGEPGRVTFDGLTEGGIVQMGQRVGSICARARSRRRTAAGAGGGGHRGAGRSGSRARKSER